MLDGNSRTAKRRRAVTDDLVKRLRKQFSIDETMQRPNFVATVYQSERDEAADRIEQLEAEIERLEKELDFYLPSL